MAQQSVRVSLPFPDPEYVQFLLKPGIEHDCYFMVGNSKLVKPERIGAVKMMLLAHSPVFRAELQDSKLREKGDVPLGDVYPDTFRHLLRFVYGYDNSSTLTFEEADNLLYAAEKYMMDLYKQKLATRLMALLSADNICSLLNNPACFTVLELDSAITKILQYETDKVLSSPLFLDLTPEGFVKILEQEAMNVAEIEIWRAAIKWAKEQTGSEDGQTLRKQLAGPLKKIRICTLDPKEDLSSEVRTQDILTKDEFKYVCKARGTKRKCESLVEVCDEIEIRRPPKMQKKNFELFFDEHSSAIFLKHFHDSAWLHKLPVTSLLVTTKESKVDLLPMTFHNSGASGETYKCDCKIEIMEIIDDSTALNPVVVHYRNVEEYNTPFAVPLICNGQNVSLLPNKTYRLKVSFTKPHNVFDKPSDYPISCYQDDFLNVTFEHVSDYGFFFSHIRCLHYQCEVRSA